MSRIGKKPINLPTGVTAEIKDRRVLVSGVQGSLELEVPAQLQVAQLEASLVVKPLDSQAKLTRALWGTYQRLLENMVTGVSVGFEKVLEFEGIGWRTEIKGKQLVLHLGFSHPISYPIPDGIDISVEKNVITIKGKLKQQVGQVAAEIRSFRKPEPYKGKGIRYRGEVILRKAGKQAKSTGTA
jgi:large subunit ribosomal protein L6